MVWEAVIGLEVHAQLRTQSKIFSGAATAYGADPNTQACAIDLGLPGVLPVLNESVVAMAIKFGLSIDASIPKKSIFARKNYFYPDLPKGYQISQYELPIVKKGHLNIQLEDGTEKRIGITRAHLEEDAGKSLHDAFSYMTGIDLNRAGTPLLEIVSDPDLRSAKEAVVYLKNLHALVRCLDICDGNMQEGSFRCDANVSVRPKGQQTLGTRAEIKNVNSFKFVERAIEYEIERQIATLENGGEILQETRLYDANKNETRSMRSKEEATDYRYFPDPDLLPVEITDSFIADIRKTLPELPAAKSQRFMDAYQLKAIDAALLTANPDLASYFEAVVTASSANPKQIANWLLGEVTAYLYRHDLTITEIPINPLQLAALLDKIENNTISQKIAKEIFEAVWNGEGDVDYIIETKGLQQMTDTTQLEKVVDDIISESPQQLEQFLAGKDKVFGYFVGQVMKKTQGKANPQKINEILQRKLNSKA